MRRILFAMPLATALTLSAQSPVSHIARTWTLGGEGGWDYLVPDPAQHGTITVIHQDTRDAYHVVENV